MRERLPLVLSVTALVVALLGTTPLGQAAGRVIAKGVPFAQTAGFASNAGKLNGHKSSTSPLAGQIPVVGSSGKLPASIVAAGAPGPAGPQGAQGAQGAQGGAGSPGPAGISGYERYTPGATPIPDGNNTNDYPVSCPGGKSVLGGGYDLGSTDVEVRGSRATSDSVWTFRIAHTTGSLKVSVNLYVICANVG